MTRILQIEAAKIGLTLTDEQLSRLDAFAEMMLEYNSHTNITRITGPEDIAVKHILDSLAVFNYVDIPRNANLLDVGAGAGFPSVPMAVYRPDISVTQLEANGKKTAFLQDAAENLSLNATVIQERAEQAAHNKRYRESFDFVTARAVAALNTLAEYCLPFVREGGKFVAFKAANVKDEMSAAKPALQALGGELEAVHEYELPGENGRSLIIVSKIGRTPAAYPRANAKIIKRPI